LFINNTVISGTNVKWFWAFRGRNCMPEFEAAGLEPKDDRWRPSL